MKAKLYWLTIVLFLAVISSPARLLATDGNPNCPSPDGCGLQLIPPPGK